MTSRLVLGLDIGTTNAKAVAFRDDGSTAAVASREYPTYHPHQGWAEQDPADWQAAIIDILRQLVSDLGAHKAEIAGLGLSSHAPGMVPVDVAGKPVIQRIPIWQDERSIRQGRWLLQKVGPEWIGLGMPFAAFGAKLKNFTEVNRERASKTEYALGVKAFIVGWLTGTCATDPSSEPGASEEWERLCKACGWSVDKLPPVMSATDVVGELRQEIAQQVGLERPIPVVLGLNDGASATLGNQGLHAGEGVITLGTNGVIFLVSERPIPASMRLERALFCWPYIENRWIIGGQTKTGAACLGWLHEVTSGSFEAPEGFSHFTLESSSTPGSNGVMFYPYLMGRGTPLDDPAATASFFGLTQRTNRPDLIRSVLEGVAYTLREVLDTLMDCDLNIERLVITGGGARNVTWRQIIADVLDQRIELSEGDSCLGAAILASVGVGLYSDLGKAVKAMQQAMEVIQPRPDSVEAYAWFYSEFIRRRELLYLSNK